MTSRPMAIGAAHDERRRLATVGVPVHRFAVVAVRALPGPETAVFGC
jgi:hypothetical protein